MPQFPSNDIVSLVESAPLHDLSESYGPNLRLSELLHEGDQSDPLEIELGYGTTQGNERLRQAIAETHHVSADDVIVTIGGAHALFLVSFTLCEPGDEVLLLTPVFPPTHAALQALGAKVTVLPLGFERGYQPDISDIAQRLSGETKLVSLATPQNPSGVAIRPETLGEIHALMAKVCPDASLLVDETYREASYGDDDAIATALGLGPRVISVASLSKCHGAPGLRIGWAITRDPGLREQLVRAKFNTVISCSAVDETLALRILQRRETIMAPRRRHLAAGLAKVSGWMREHAHLVDWIAPDAGALCCARLNPSIFGDADVERFYQATTRHGLRVAKGAWFGADARVFRLGFGFVPIPALELGLAALSLAVREVAKKHNSNMISTT